jgi:UDP-glucose 4-epimerase
MKTLVVGGAGYIGSHVVKELLRQDHEVVVFDNLRTGLRENIPEGVTFFEGDILIESQLQDCLSQHSVEGIIHLAALKAAGESMLIPEKYSTCNIQGTINLLNQMVQSEVRNLVFSSTAAVYGSPSYLPMDENHPRNPENFYGYTKSIVEDLFDWYEKLHGIKFAKLRYFNAAGYDVEGHLKGLEKNPANLLPVVMETALGMRESFQVFGDDYPTRDGSGVRDYIHVSDLATAHNLALEYLESKSESLAVNLGTGQGISVFEIISAVESLTQKKLNYKVVGRRAGDPAEILATSQLAFDLLGWKTQHSDVETLVKTTWDAYLSNQ